MNNYKDIRKRVNYWMNNNSLDFGNQDRQFLMKEIDSLNKEFLKIKKLLESADVDRNGYFDTEPALKYLDNLIAKQSEKG